MTPHDLYLEAANRGLRLEVAGDKLAVFPKGHCPPEFAEVLRQHKTELLAWLTRPTHPGWGAIPPQDLPLDKERPTPTPAARERVIGFMLRQTGGRHTPLNAWLVRRENQYYAGPAQSWDCAIIAYAVARDCACWQLNCPEQRLWDYLLGFQEAAPK